MRTLMLHGHATSAFIFKAQTVPFRSKLDKTFSFDFVDGPYPCAPPRGLSSVVSIAYTWFKSPDANSIRNAVAWLTQYIEKNGPYDSICCFSKASVVVVAMMMYAAREGTDESRKRIMPKSLVIMNGGIEYSFLEDLGLPITEEARRIKFKTEEQVRSKADALSKLSRATVRPGATNGLWDDTSRLMHDPTKLSPLSNCFGLDFTSLPEDLLIHLPTVHILGGKDPIWPSSVQLANLCHPDKRSFYDHRGGHDLPRTPKVSSDIAEIFKDLARKLHV
ncbi:hypothetical protein BP5796_12179 [Coleophoma crateriformis]|uniref:Serine hydrolase domain-containing protein n=1 Tax=Coleophoma crateriformis TaxID=565419 RepID=A0A3D8QBM0_9HELO|nr:hypothetical protein BP5796_12179 [Coleophoma crateriformis]